MEVSANKLAVITALGATLLTSGCAGEPRMAAATPRHVERPAAESIRRSVAHYLMQSPVLDDDFRNALTAFSQSTNANDLGEWTYSQDKCVLYHHGYQIADEHTWYEVHLSVESNRVTVIKAVKQREHIR